MKAKVLGYVLLFLSQVGFCQSNFELGKAWYEDRAKQSDGLIANTQNIDQAISFLKKGKKSPESIALLLRAYEFKGTYSQLDEKAKKKIYKKAIKIGKKGIRKYTNDLAIKYAYIINLGRWGQSVNPVKAQGKGLIKKIRNLSNDILKTDSSYAEAGACRLLGIMHWKLPSIPFVMSWPSQKTATQLLFSAYKLAPENPSNVRLYAEILIEENRKKAARLLLKELIERLPRETRKIEDSVSLKEAKKIYEKLLENS